MAWPDNLVDDELKIDSYRTFAIAADDSERR